MRRDEDDSIFGHVETLTLQYKDLMDIRVSEQVVDRQGQVHTANLWGPISVSRCIDEHEITVVIMEGAVNRSRDRALVLAFF